MPSTDIARRIAELDEQIADTESRIFQHQKRVENLEARGADASDLRDVIKTLGETLADLRTHRQKLAQQAQQGPSRK